jgi:hypothetical protein
VDPPGFRCSEVEDLSDEENENDVVSPLPDKSKGFSSSNDDYSSHESQNGFWQLQAKRMSRIPRIYLAISSLAAIVLSVIGFQVGGFEASVDNAGWQSRGTQISDRQTQLMMTSAFQQYLFFGGEEAWDDLTKNVQDGWQSNRIKGGEDGAKASTEDKEKKLDGKNVTIAPPGEGRLLSISEEFSSQKSRLSSSMRMNRRLQEDMVTRLSEEPSLKGCNVTWYLTSEDFEEEHLWPIWKSESASSTILDPQLMRDVCEAELNTQKVLEDNNLCFGCEEGCLPPFSPVFYARYHIPGGFEMDCKKLSEEWANIQDDTTSEWGLCVEELKEAYDPINDWEMPGSCPFLFSTTLVENNFDATEWMTITSSIFATAEKDVDAMYDICDEFDQGTDRVLGAYDTQDEGFNKIFTQAVVGRDMGLACASAFITAIAILVHTKSPFLTGIGLLQIILSFPLSFFVYTFVGGLEFFPFLNFIGVFVVFALGADDIFVAVDKWKNARLEHPDKPTDFVAAIALPDAAGAMFLTTITTAIAFFGTAICPVAPIKMFAIFCGLLIMFDYLMCILLVFPALCIYDQKIMAQRSNCCNACHCFQKKRAETNIDLDEDDLEDPNKMSLIHRILYKYYQFIHRFRWALLFLSTVAFGLSIWGATTFELPTSSEVRLIAEDAVQFEQNFIWRQDLLYEALQKTGGSDVLIGFGLSPADTGDQNNPDEWSQLVLDSTFDAAPAPNQEFLESFCPDMFDNEWATLPFDNYTCAFNRFGAWLEEQAIAPVPNPVYTDNCGGATSIPVAEEDLDACLIGWSKLFSETSILSNEGKVRIIFFPFISRVRFDSPFDELDAEWNLLEEWTKATNSDAPTGVNKMFFSSMDFWWYDTNGQMISTAVGAGAIALAAAAIVIFLSSRSLVLTLFATLTIAYVLCSVTSTLVALGWSLGFLESICFAILIGVSVDFVIHFCHAYAHLSGDVDRHKRSQDALIRMGPSILAAGVTTISAAIIMLFTIISFFQKFALILFMSIIQATIGSFIIFLVLTDCIGPSNPTYLVDKLLGCVFGAAAGTVKSVSNGTSKGTSKTKKASDESSEDVTVVESSHGRSSLASKSSSLSTNFT